MATPTTAPDESNGAMAHQPRTGQVARRDFSGSSLTTQQASTDALVAKARADVEARWIIAQRMRRSLDDVRQDLLAECARPSFARVAMYARPVGKKEVDGKWVNAVAEGLSIRFAEAAARCMGNLQPDQQTIYDGPGSRIVRVTVTDYETNVTWSKDLNISKTVERKHLKKGQRPLGERENSYGDRVFIVEATDDETNVKEAAMVSKTARTLILRVVPGHIQDECKAKIKEVAAQADAKDPAGARNRCFDAFASVGVRPAEIAKYLGHALDTCSPSELDELRGVYTAIRDGEATWAEVLEDALDVPPQAKATQPPPPAQPENVKAAPAPTSEPTKPVTQPATPKAKGAAALKASIAKPAEPAKPAPDPALEEPGWMAGGTKQTPEPDGPQVASAEPPPGYVELPCTRCKGPMDVKESEVTDPPTHRCYACANE